MTGFCAFDMRRRLLPTVIALALLAGCATHPKQQTVTDDTRKRLAEALLLNGDKANAAEALRSPAERAAAQAPDAVDQAAVLIAAGQVDQGMTVAKSALAARGDDPPLALGVAKMAIRANRLGDAAEIYQRISQRHPDNVEALNGSAVVLAQQGDLAGAEKMLRRAMALRPTDVPVRGNLALVLLLSNQTAAAVPVLEELQRTNPSSQFADLLTLAMHRLHPERAG